MPGTAKLDEYFVPQSGKRIEHCLGFVKTQLLVASALSASLDTVVSVSSLTFSFSGWWPPAVAIARAFLCDSAKTAHTGTPGQLALPFNGRVDP